MAKDRMFFLFSFAFLGIVAAFLFRTPDVKPAPEVKVDHMQADAEKASIEVLFATAPMKEHEHLTQNNYAWKKIPLIDFNAYLITKTPETEKLLANAIAAKDIPKDTKIMRSDVFWPMEAPKNVDSNSIAISPGRRAVPFEITKKFGLVQFIKPGMFVDITFNAKADSSFGAVSLTLLKNIRVLAIGSDQEDTTSRPGALARSGAPLEILLEMTPKQADVFSYAKSSGEVSLQFLNDLEEDKSDLADKLLKSDSPGDFRSILVTNLIRNIFPNTDVTITAIPKGYVASGKVPDPQKAAKIMEVLSKLAPDGDKAVVNLMESEIRQQNIENADHGFAEEEPEPDILPLTPGKRPILFELAANPGFVQFIEPGRFLDVTFTSKSDIGFGAVRFTLLRGIRVLGIESEIEKHHFSKNKGMNKTGSPIQILLEMDPHQADIFFYAQETGLLSLGIDEGNASEQDLELARELWDSTSPEDFRSILVTNMIRALFPQIDVDITATPKGYVVTGKVSDQQKADKVIEIIQRLGPIDEKSIVNLLEVVPQQVLICVKVFEINKDVSQSLGLNWKLLFQNGSQSATFGTMYPEISVGNPDYFVSASGIQMGQFNLSAFIDILQEDDGARILAEPNITTISGKTAHFFAGGEFPILIPQGGPLVGTVTIEYKKYGVLLDFTPVVDLNGLITLQVVPEISTIDKQTSVVLSGYAVPGLISRRVDTVVKLWPGQSYMIAGLLQSEITETNYSLYGLDKLPIIGPLFSSRSFIDNETELMIMVTPYLISSEKPEYIRPLPCSRCGCFHDVEDEVPCSICGCVHDDQQICQWD